MLLTFDVERAASLGALSAAAKRDQMIFLAAQKDLTVDLPEAEDIYRVGTVCRIRQQLRQPQGGMCRVMVEGLYRAESLGVHTDPKGYSALVRALPEKEEHPGAARTEALLRSCVSLFQEYLQLNPEMPGEQILNVLGNPKPAYVSDYIAQNVTSNIRELEGCLNRIRAKSVLEKRTITLSLAEEILKDLISPDENRSVTSDMIIAIVAEHFHLTASEIRSPKRDAKYVYPRKIAMYLCREMTDDSLMTIAGHLGKRDHTTVISACRKIEKEMQTNPETRNHVDTIRKKITPRA